MEPQEFTEAAWDMAEKWTEQELEEKMQRIKQFVKTAGQPPLKHYRTVFLPLLPTKDELEWIEQQRKLQNELLSGLQLISPEHLEENYNAH